ncbi:hypothetical protein ACF073_22790 [Streptomyces sp. NPDC015171]|uniref:hypothetical protein n=1 Tax=Streptomyces sp. NPDC015171 TaxID=3364945 RepID=UPI0036FB2F04
MRKADPALDELESAARDAPAELVARLLRSEEPRTARLGRAIRDIQSRLSDPAPAHTPCGDGRIDPITHDPGW